MSFDRDPPARRYALVHWIVDRWVLVIACRHSYGVNYRSQLEARGAELSGPWQVLDVTGRVGSVEAAVAALSPPSSDGGELGAQLGLFDV